MASTETNVLRHKRAIANRILRWFDNKKRDLPWLKNRTPYQIWVSEIMLQQTQITTVIDYYRRFVRRFPNVKRLADADVDEVLKQWEGLGYYRRARQLHKAAQLVVEKHGGQFPTDFKDVIDLPGIGRYTAAAILSISLDQKQPILEGNTIRLFSRMMLLKEDTARACSQKQLWKFSESLLPNRRVGDFNQALMDLGREVCRPKLPDCTNCVVAGFCQARIQGKQRQIPARSAKMQYEDLNEAIVLVGRRGKILLRKCNEGERWTGLWDFPRFEVDGNVRPVLLESKIQKHTGLFTKIERLNHTMKHAVTRYRIKLECFQAKTVSGRLLHSSDYHWKQVIELKQLPLNKTGRKFANLYVANRS